LIAKVTSEKGMELFIKYGEVQGGKHIEDRGVGFLETKE